MRVEDGKVILERKNCTRCRYNDLDGGLVAAEKYIKCTKCRGTGRRGGGNCRNCKGQGTVLTWDHDNPVTCQRCNGNYEGFEPENYTDTIPAEIVQGLEWIVIRKNRQMHWSEQHLGHGLGSCVDYGRHKNQTDEELIEHERSRAVHVQASKVVKSKEDLTLAKGIAIVTSEQGYSMIPYWEE